MQYLILTLFLLWWTCVDLDAQPTFDMQGGAVQIQRESCLPESMRSQIKEDIAQNLVLLGLDGRRKRASVPTNLIFPLIMPDPPAGYFHFSGISNYVDHDASDSLIVDHSCRDNTYDGHDGTDYFTFPFKWLLVEGDLVHVVSTTTGTIILKNDGNPHLNCERRGAWNAVYVQHDDGSQFWYGHLKSGSLTSKAVGDRVEQGEYLGVVASSGYSNAPHLHLECYDAEDNLLDPYQGLCNPLNDFSLWDKQAPYISPKINALLTHSKQPSIDCERINEVSALSNTFYPGDTMYSGIYITDYQKDSVIRTNVLRPDNSLYASFNSFSFESSYNSFWNWRRYILTEDDPEGIWTIEASYGDELRRHTFEFIKEVTNSRVESKMRLDISPNPTNGKLRVEGLANPGGSYQIFDASGRSLEKGDLVSDRIDLAEYHGGIYYLQISQGGDYWIKKFVLR